MKDEKCFTPDCPLMWAEGRYRRTFAKVGDSVQIEDNVYRVKHILPHTLNEKHEIVFLERTDSRGLTYQTTRERPKRSAYWGVQS